MWPIVFRIGNAALYAYPLMASLAYFAALGIWYRLTRKPEPLSGSSLVNLSLGASLCGWMGARALFLVTQFAQGENVWSFWDLWQGGVVFYGGAIAGALYLYWAFPREHISRKRGFDTLAPGMAVAHAMGRIGCFLNGCCYGSHCDFPWAIHYENPYSAAPLHEALHPTQLYEAFLLLVLAGILVWRHRWSEADSPRPLKWGNLRFYVFAYSGIRFVLEFYRGDLRRGFWGPFSTSQWVSLSLGFIALFVPLLRGLFSRKRALDFRRRKDHN